MQHKPRKRFGQNFLQNSHVINAIIKAFHPKRTDHVIEIGPGQGALTRPLLHFLDALTAIEIDRDLYQQLSELPNAGEKLHLVNADALTTDYRQFGSSLRLIGNLPYNISTPLILHLIRQIDSIEDMHFMLQKEVVERLAASPGSKDYGRLSIIVQYFCQVEPILNVPPDAFFPMPKVESAVVRMIPHTELPYPAVSFNDLEIITARAFAMRRKTVANNFKGLLTVDELNSLGVDAKLRPEQLSITDYARIAKFVAN